MLHDKIILFDIGDICNNVLDALKLRKITVFCKILYNDMYGRLLFQVGAFAVVPCCSTFVSSDV